jgi:uncharacterized protein
MLRVVLNTNVRVSAIISRGNPRELLRKGLSKQFCITTSDLILNKLGTVLRRSKFKTSKDEVHRIILALIQTAEVVDVVSRISLVEEDPKDDMAVETAYDGRANFVTGDSHLSAIKNFKEIKIVGVKQMLVYLEE